MCRCLLLDPVAAAAAVVDLVAAVVDVASVMKDSLRRRPASRRLWIICACLVLAGAARPVSADYGESSIAPSTKMAAIFWVRYQSFSVLFFFVGGGGVGVCRSAVSGHECYRNVPSLDGDERERQRGRGRTKTKKKEREREVCPVSSDASVDVALHAGPSEILPPSVNDPLYLPAHPPPPAPFPWKRPRKLDFESEFLPGPVSLRKRKTPPATLRPAFFTFFS